ncbi:hypothetical protein ABPG74_020111 [Tetrahymena malaccensis]
MSPLSSLKLFNNIYNNNIQKLHKKRIKQNRIRIYFELNNNSYINSEQHNYSIINRKLNNKSFINGKYQNHQRTNNLQHDYSVKLVLVAATQVLEVLYQQIQHIFFNTFNYQTSPSKTIKLDTSKLILDCGFYVIHFNNQYYNQTVFIQFSRAYPNIIGSAYIFTNVAQTGSDEIYYHVSDENKKQNIQKKKRYQDQFNKHLIHIICDLLIRKQLNIKKQEFQDLLKDNTLKEEKRNNQRMVFSKFKCTKVKQSKVLPIKICKNLVLNMLYTTNKL